MRDGGGESQSVSTWFGQREIDCPKQISLPTVLQPNLPEVEAIRNAA